MNHLILAINPGSTSTKVALFKNDEQTAASNISHPESDLSKFASIFDQLDYRTGFVKTFLEGLKVPVESLSAIVGRGGPIMPLVSGTYHVDEKMIDALKHRFSVMHISLLGGLIASSIAAGKVGNVFLVDPVCVDEMCDEARISGHESLSRVSHSHALNVKAVARMAARDLGRDYSELNLVVAHLGSGVSVTSHLRGRMIDVNNAYDEGPFSVDRTGGLPLTGVIEMCFSGKYTKNDIKTMFLKKGGLISYFNTNDAKSVADRMLAGDPKAATVLKAMAYQVSKEIGGMATTLCGKLDAVVITGGMAKSEPIVDMIKERVGFLGRILVYPGEDEFAAMAGGALRVLSGKEEARRLAF